MATPAARRKATAVMPAMTGNFLVMIRPLVRIIHEGIVNNAEQMTNDKSPMDNDASGLARLVD